MAGPQNAAFPAGIYSQSPLQQQLAALSSPINPPSMTSGSSDSFPAPLLPNAQQPGINPAQNPSFMAALAALTAPHKAAAPTVQSVMQDWAQQVAGAAPAPVTAESFGAAPTLGQYWDPSSYDAASTAVGNSNTAGQGTINDAYGQAMQQLLAEGGHAADQAAQGVSTAQSQANTAGAQEHAAITTALQGAAPGGLLSNQLNAQQATLDANNQRGVTTAQAMQGLTNSNNSDFQQGLSSSKANALQYLASQVQGELSKIGMAKSAAQTSSERDYQNALNAWNTNTNNANISASNANAKNQATYSGSLQDALKEATAASNSQATSPRDTLMKQINSGQVDPTVANFFTQFVQGNSTAGPAKNLPDSMSRLQGAASQLQAKGINPATIATMIQQYWNTTKSAPTPAALKAYLQGYS